MDALAPSDNRLVLILNDAEARALDEILRYAGVQGVHKSLNQSLRDAIQSFAPRVSPLSAQRVGAFG